MFILNVLIIAVLLGAILTAITAQFRRICGFIGVISVGIISLILFYVAYRVFTLGPQTLSQPIFAIPSLGAQLSITVDYLSAVFLVLIGLISFLGTLYSYRYMDIYPNQSLGRFYPFLILFIVGMIGVVSVSDMFFFFVFWEFMTLTSYFLVIYEKEDPVCLRAGLKYFIMTHIGTAAMFIAAIMLQTEMGSFSFVLFQEALGRMVETQPVRVSVILALFLLGFGTKAGMYPLGTWLPDAHPAAPSGVSAMLSGVMIKIGIYGILRFFFFLLPPSSHSFAWGIVIAIFGAISLFMGTISALLQHDSKRLLAFHSIGQIGYILLGIGTGLTFLRINPMLSAVATFAGMYHLFNHTTFKSLLFLNAGSILYKTGTRDLNKLGGLYSVMPITAWTTLIAAFSISGMPPFNGFVSKWLIYQTTILGGIEIPVFVLFGLMAIFISSATLASFMKFFNTSFGGEISKSLELSLRPGKDVPYSMRLPQNILAILCLVLGLFPWLPLLFSKLGFSGSSYGAIGYSLSALFGNSVYGLTPVFNGGRTSGVWLPLTGTLFFLGCLILAFIVYRIGKPQQRIVPLWNCGEVYEVDEVRYRAESYYLPLVSFFERLVYPEFPALHIKRPERIHKSLDFDQILYYPLVNLVLRISQRFRRTHVGIPQAYMLYQVIGIILLGLVVLWISIG